MSSPHVAVRYQAIYPPTINGVRKPKPGGYQDSGADIAYNKLPWSNTIIFASHPCLPKKAVFE